MVFQANKELKHLFIKKEGRKGREQTNGLYEISTMERAH